uniref:Uncharacterized protein n=1 Tax=Gallus gallus TaxID=9031 RepID=A0A8V0X650_CHICK
VKELLVDGEQTTLQIWDTAGQERYRSIARSYFRKAHGVLLLYDISSQSSFLSVRQWIEDIEVTGRIQQPPEQGRASGRAALGRTAGPRAALCSCRAPGPPCHSCWWAIRATCGPGCRRWWGFTQPTDRGWPW